MKHIAVIDCGTNTFTLSLFEVGANDTFERILKDRHYVELAEDSISFIGKGAYERGKKAFESFKQRLDTYSDCKTFAIGTAALRRATNGKAFIADILTQTGLEIQVIGGDREAQLIYQGVRLAAPLSEQPSLIMDIGGGSVEFIICDKQTVFWAQSFKVGVAVLHDLFHKNEPITEPEIDNIRNYLTEELQPLLANLKTYDPHYLVGASGSFDVLDNLTRTTSDHDLYSFISLTQFDDLHKQLTKLTYEQRKNTKDLPHTRAKLIVMSMVLIDFVLQYIEIDQLVVSDYALREGLVWELLQAK